jgi:hypothetical protein
LGEEPPIGGAHAERVVTDRWDRKGIGARLAVRGGREREAGRFRTWVGPVRQIRPAKEEISFSFFKEFLKYRGVK